MTRYGVPMPDTIRTLLRGHQHPARAVTCPHCGAHDRNPCTTPDHRRRLTAQVHPSRINAWAVATAVCPTCQVAPGSECQVGGRAIPEPHPQRVQEAEVTA